MGMESGALKTGVEARHHQVKFLKDQCQVRAYILTSNYIETDPLS